LSARPVSALIHAVAERRNLEGYVRSPARGLGVTEGDLT